MDILIKLVFKSFLNPLSLYIYDNTNNNFFILIICTLFVIFVLPLIVLYVKRRYSLFTINLSIIVIMVFIFVYSYNRGCALNDIRNNGFLILKNIEQFKLLENRYPYNIEEIYEYISKADTKNYQKILKTRNVYSCIDNTLRNDSSYKFNLTINSDMLGFEYFAYRNNPVKFILTDD